MSEPSSRWLTTQFLCVCRNSIGSSIVRMCSCLVMLIRSIIVASVVDFPEPVGPVTRMRPRGLRQRSATTCGKLKFFERAYFVRDHAKHATDSFFLVEDIYAKTRKAFEADRKVQFAVLAETLRLIFG